MIVMRGDATDTAHFKWAMRMHNMHIIIISLLLHFIIIIISFISQ